MDSFSLKTASTYVNNLLLARGLGDGKAIEFAKPSKAEGGTEATMAQIINVMHDLLLRRDREQEQREALVQTVRTLRAQEDRRDIATDRLQTRCEDLERQLSLCKSQERAARAALRTAESSSRALREEQIRLKALVGQVRAACANDVRKRDVQLQRLKTHLAAQQRGNKTGLVGMSVTITPGTIGSGTGAGHAPKDEAAPNLDDPAYSLKQETTEFLTQLSQGLSDENDHLIGLVRNTLSTLRHLQGMPENLMRPVDNVSSHSVDKASSATNMVQALPSSCETLSTDMEMVLDSLKTLLTSPNFVSIEEVSVREEEITRLRDGFEKLESRWKEAIALMNSWRERLEKDGDTVNLEEIKMGLGLGVGFGASVYVSRAGDDSSQLEGISEENENIDLDDLDFDSAMEDDVPAVSPDVLQKARTKNELDQEPRLPGRVLSEANGNGTSPKKVAFFKPSMPTPPGEENTSEIDFLNLSPQKEAGVEKPVNVTVRPAASRLPRKALKRQSSPERQQHAGHEPKLTVQEKLEATRAEAEAAVTERASKSRRVVSGERKAVGRDEVDSTQTRPPPGPSQTKRELPAKRVKVAGRPRRRKSTLTRDELADMLVGLI